MADFNQTPPGGSTPTRIPSRRANTPKPRFRVEITYVEVTEE